MMNSSFSLCHSSKCNIDLVHNKSYTSRYCIILSDIYVYIYIYHIETQKSRYFKSLLIAPTLGQVPGVVQIIFNNSCVSLLTQHFLFICAFPTAAADFTGFSLWKTDNVSVSAAFVLLLLTSFNQILKYECLIYNYTCISRM